MTRLDTAKAVAACQATRNQALTRLYEAEERFKSLAGKSTDADRIEIGNVRARYWTAERALNRALEDSRRVCLTP